MLKTLKAVRYVTALREGGSLPAIVEADNGLLYVMKFVGAGQGPKALIAELVAGELARALSLPIPEIVLLDLDPILGRSEPNPEIQDLLRFSAGLNLGLRYLPQAFDFNLLLQPPPPVDLASHIVWFDAYITNVDRTPRNVNLLVWEDGLWLIDHGAALYFHHDWSEGYLERSQNKFPLIKDHTLLPFASQLAEVDLLSHQSLTPDIIEGIINSIPAVWLGDEPAFANHQAHRAAYLAYLLKRLEAAPLFVEEALHARQGLV